MPQRKPTSRPPAPLARAAAVTRRFGFVIFAVVVIVGAAAYGVHQGREQGRAGSGSGDVTTAQTVPAQPPFQSEQQAAKGQPVREVFAHSCGTCHTLRGAQVQGIIGPDLDRAVLTPTKVRTMIRTGSLDTVMPRNLLVGEDADRVARYVARLSIASRRAREGG